MSIRRHSMDVMRPICNAKNLLSNSSNHISTNSCDEYLALNGFDRIPDCYNATSSDSSDNSDNLNLDRLSVNTKYVKFERYSKRLISLGREILSRDHTYDRAGLRVLNIHRYLHLRDRISSWIIHPDNLVLFTDRETYFYLAQMEAIMRTLDITFGLQHRHIPWPGAIVGLQHQPTWPGVQKREVYQHFDRLIHGGENWAMPLNWKEDARMSD